MSAPHRPIMRYHGGKWKLGKWIVSNLPPHRIYVEPYGGAASVLMQKPRSYSEVYNDLDQEVVGLFRVLRDPCMAERLIHLLELTPYSRAEFYLSYLPAKDPVEQARRTLLRAQAGHGTTVTGSQRTGFRGNVTRPRTTPAHDWRSYPPIIKQVVERLRGVIIQNEDALAVINRYDTPETLFYIDPPYAQVTRGASANRAYRHEMNDRDHEQLAQLLHKVDGMVVLSGYQSDLYARLFGSWRMVTRSAFADGAREREEALWLNEAATENLWPLLSVKMED